MPGTSFRVPACNRSRFRSRRSIRNSTGPGRRITPKTSNVQLDQGEGNRRDRIALGALENPTPDRWFDISAFPVVPTGSYRFGNSGRNVLDGPGFVGINLGLSRRLRIGDCVTLQFR